MIFTTILITCFFALAGVMQAPVADTFLLSLTLLSLPSLSAVSNVFTISSPMLVPSLPLPAVLEPYSDLLLQVTIPFNFPSKALGLASSTSAAPSSTYSPTPRDDTSGSKPSLALRVILLFFILPSVTAVFIATLHIASTCKPSLFFLSRIQDQLLSLLEDISAPRTIIIITDYQGLTQSIGYTLLLDDSSLPAQDDIDSASLAVSTSLCDILFASVSDSICMPLNDPAPLHQQINEAALACTTGWSVVATGLEDDGHQVEFESFETGERLVLYTTHEEFEEWAGPFRDDG
ncbi:hypothetical protein L226DRAFT_558477 [Lentinus tigrinus ALCF2SS1-7]|uniref:uncharacterized protein n=1 Tax=Lentinus tigrinus ALCF2SS1-7 TaxID=1328758 RepID=UPI001165D985|nr:hypothetical protein L226DRAFT_558477 [Lentinus tigrinus ALCF2SS1-7]